MHHEAVLLCGGIRKKNDNFQECLVGAIISHGDMIDSRFAFLPLMDVQYVIQVFLAGYFYDGFGL